MTALNCGKFVRSRKALSLCSCLAMATLGLSMTWAQPEVMPWGNVTGIRVDGEKMAFETSLRAVKPDWSGFVWSSKYNWDGQQTYTENGKTHTASHFLQGTKLNYTVKVTETGAGKIRITLDVDQEQEMPMAGAYFCVELPAADFVASRLESKEIDGRIRSFQLPDSGGTMQTLFKVRTREVHVIGVRRTLSITADEPEEILVRQDFVDQPSYLNDPHPRLFFTRSDPRGMPANYQIYFPVLPSDTKVGSTASTSFEIEIGGEVDHRPVNLSLDATQPGRRFDGIGGNFRVQQPAEDARVMDYLFNHLDVAWGRVAFLWDEWQPEEAKDRGAEFREGNMSPKFRDQVEMARTLAQKGIPFIVSIWKPPAWAVDPGPKPVRGSRLDPAKLDKIADSIADFLVFLKQQYGAEASLFSFNETDYGVEVKQSPEEHALHNKILGEHFAARGLATRMLLGDTGAGTANANKMVLPSEGDQSIWPYLGAVSFHTYHGVTPTDLAAWSATAKHLNLPLMLVEGGADSAAHRYPHVFLEPWFAQKEIDTYVRAIALGQVSTVMVWQLNADYSLLTGEGIYGSTGPLRPTQRFWNLKQLGATPRGSFWLPIQADQPNLTVAALGNLASSRYVIHIVNNGASREATLSGIPSGVKALRIYITDGTRGMDDQGQVSVQDGRATFQLEAASFTTLLSVAGDTERSHMGHSVPTGN